MGASKLNDKHRRCRSVSSFNVAALRRFCRCAAEHTRVHIADILKCSAVSIPAAPLMKEYIMNIVSWTPFQEMNRLLGRPFGGLLMGRWPASTEDIEAGESSWIPVLDVSETESEYLVRADLPAVKKEDVTVTIENDVLTIAGERKFEKAEASEKVHRRESIRGTFTRSLSLPENANASGIRAESRDGVLTVHVPKTKVERTKALEIKVQ